MKRLSELVKEWRELKAVPTMYQCCHGNCADELQAWLREADNALHESLLSSESRLWVRQKIYGSIFTSTTQKPKQEGEK